MQTLYNALLWSLRPAIEAVARWPRKESNVQEMWRQRRGLDLPAVGAPPIWIHGSSVGESLLVRTIAERLATSHPDDPQLLTAMTPSGRAQLEAAPNRSVAHLPFDWPRFLNRAFDSWQPRLLILVETELWPNLIRTAKQRDCPIVLCNARLSEEKFAQYQRWQALYRPTIQRLASICARTERDAQRFVSLGASPSQVQVVGDLKFDREAPGPEQIREVAEAAGLRPGTPSWVAGSVRQGEAKILLEAHKQLLSRGLQPVMFLAPRHLKRAESLLQAAFDAGLEAQLWRDAPPVPGSVRVVDTFGVLGALYGIAEVSFVGGTLVPLGGHNLLEPAAVGCPVLFGPHVDNVADSAELLLQSGAGAQVSGAQDLANCVGAYLDSADERSRAGEAGLHCLEAHRGAWSRTHNQIHSLLQCPENSAPRGDAS